MLPLSGAVVKSPNCSEQSSKTSTPSRSPIPPKYPRTKKCSKHRAIASDGGSWQRNEQPPTNPDLTQRTTSELHQLAEKKLPNTIPCISAKNYFSSQQSLNLLKFHQSLDGDNASQGNFGVSQQEPPPNPADLVPPIRGLLIQPMQPVDKNAISELKKGTSNGNKSRKISPTLSRETSSSNMRKVSPFPTSQSQSTRKLLLPKLSSRLDRHLHMDKLPEMLLSYIADNPDYPHKIRWVFLQPTKEMHLLCNLQSSTQRKTYSIKGSDFPNENSENILPDAIETQTVRDRETNGIILPRITRPAEANEGPASQQAAQITSQNSVSEANPMLSKMLSQRKLAPRKSSCDFYFPPVFLEQILTADNYTSEILAAIEEDRPILDIRGKTPLRPGSAQASCNEVSPNIIPCSDQQIVLQYMEECGFLNKVEAEKMLNYSQAYLFLNQLHTFITAQLKNIQKSDVPVIYDDMVSQIVTFVTRRLTPMLQVLSETIEKNFVENTNCNLCLLFAPMANSQIMKLFRAISCRVLDILCESNIGTLTKTITFHLKKDNEAQMYVFKTMTGLPEKSRPFSCCCLPSEVEKAQIQINDIEENIIFFFGVLAFGERSDRMKGREMYS